MADAIPLRKFLPPAPEPERAQRPRRTGARELRPTGLYRYLAEGAYGRSRHSLTDSIRWAAANAFIPAGTISPHDLPHPEAALLLWYAQSDPEGFVKRVLCRVVK